MLNPWKKSYDQPRQHIKKQRHYFASKGLSSQKYGLKVNIQKTKIMTSGPMTSWQIEGEKVETVTDFIFLASKNTVGEKLLQT